MAPSKLSDNLVCAVTGELVDRDHNAAKNLRDWPETQMPVSDQLGPRTL